MPSLAGGFLYSGETVVDLQSSWPPASLSFETGACFFDATVVDNFDIQTNGGALRIVNLDRAIDRDDSTVYNFSTSVAEFLMPAGLRVHAVKALGNRLVVAERRGDGTYLEVFDVRKIRDRLPGTTFSPVADSLGSYRVTTNVSPADGYSALTLRNGRAFVTLDGPGAGIYAVDLRPLLDDTAATVMGPDGDQGFIAPGNPAATARAARWFAGATPTWRLTAIWRSSTPPRRSTPIRRRRLPRRRRGSASAARC